MTFGRGGEGMVVEGDLSYAGISVITVLSAGIGAFIGAYLKKKAENLATHEDLNKLVEQMATVTQTTESIKAAISDDVWDRQRRWEMRRDAVFSVMQALGKADETLHFASLATVELRKAGDKASFEVVNTEAWNTFYAAIDDFDQKRALALLVCGKEMSDTLMKLKKHLRDLAHMLGNGEIEIGRAHV